VSINSFQYLSQTNPSQKRAGGVAHDVVPEFKYQYHKKKKKKKSFKSHPLILFCSGPVNQALEKKNQARPWKSPEMT
jgi:hypothetical protein